MRLFDFRLGESRWKCGPRPPGRPGRRRRAGRLKVAIPQGGPSAARDGFGRAAVVGAAGAGRGPQGLSRAMTQIEAPPRPARLERAAIGGPRARSALGVRLVVIPRREVRGQGERAPPCPLTEGDRAGGRFKGTLRLELHPVPAGGRAAASAQALEPVDGRPSFQGRHISARPARAASQAQAAYGIELSPRSQRRTVRGSTPTSPAKAVALSPAMDKAAASSSPTGGSHGPGREIRQSGRIVAQAAPGFR